MCGDVGALSPLRGDDARRRDQPAWPVGLPSKVRSALIRMHPRRESSQPQGGQDRQAEPGWSGLIPRAGWRVAAFCAEDGDGSSRTRHVYLGSGNGASNERPRGTRRCSKAGVAKPGIWATCEVP